MERISVSLPVAGGKRSETFDFAAADAHSMLSWLDHDMHVRNALYYRNGERLGRLRRMGGDGHSYWMIVPD